MLLSEKLCYKYALITFLFFGLQGIVSIGGALDTVLPDINLPIPYTAGRSFHLNISIFWPLFGITGIIYYFFGQEAEREIHSLKLIEVNFWLLFTTLLAILGSLLLGFNEGIEYLEAWRPFKVGIALSIIILFYNILRTYFAANVSKSRATLVSILSGIFTLIIFFLPNIFRYVHPVAEELIKFWVVHLWEEMSLELIGTGVLAAFLVKLPGMQRNTMEKVIYLDISVMVLTGVFATGHHYYWVGASSYWIWVGAAFSTVQIVPTLLLLYAIFQKIKIWDFNKLKQREKIVVAMIGCSMFYHIFGAGLLGFFMAIPAINKYIHGTYITSAHSHLALFGVFGFLVLALCYHIFFSGISLNENSYWLSWVGLAFVNAGLLVMAAALLVAGGLQSQLWYVLGLGAGTTNQLILPWLFLRLAGGLMYTVGSSIFSYVIIKNAWGNHALFFPSLKELNLQRDIKLQNIHSSLQQLIFLESKMEQILRSIKSLLDQYPKIK